MIPRKPIDRYGKIMHRGAILATLLLVANPVMAREPWGAPLARGGWVEVDPRTNRPLLIQDGRQTQLWDGVHRLLDGSVIQVREGRVVPTLEMLSPPRAVSLPDQSNVPPTSDQPGAEYFSGASPCTQLILRACGAANHCWAAPACAAARQLLEMEQKDWPGGGPGFITDTGNQCREALSNRFFAPCR